MFFFLLFAVALRFFLSASAFFFRFVLFYFVFRSFWFLFKYRKSVVNLYTVECGNVSLVAASPQSNIVFFAENTMLRL